MKIENNAQFTTVIGKFTVDLSDILILSDVQKAIEKVKIARRDDLDKLSKKFDKLQKVVERLEKKISSFVK